MHVFTFTLLIYWEEMRIPHDACCNFLHHYFCNALKLKCSALHMLTYFSEQAWHLAIQHKTIINMVTKLQKKLQARTTLHLVIYLLGGLFLCWCRLKTAVFSSHSQNQEIAFENFSRTKSAKNGLKALNMSGIYPFNTRCSWNVTQVSSKHSHLSHSLQVKMVVICHH